MENTENAKIKKAEEYIDFLTKCLNEKDLCNISQTEKIGSRYEACKDEIKFQYFVFSGDKHYYAARLLFLSGICEYSFFSAQQCVELHLKGYLKYKKINPPDSHNLIELVRLCKNVDKVDDFICSDRIMTIAERFNPFYEYPRYPVQKIRPKNAQYAFMYPDDIVPLDYFVFKMREIIPCPKDMHDILKEGHLNDVDFNGYSIHADKLFKYENINFQ